MSVASDREAVVTGATGFIGSHLVRRLVNEGWLVHAIVHQGSDVRTLQGLGSNVSIFHHDGTLEGMKKLFSRTAPTVVFHLASYFTSEHKDDDIPQLVESNILFGLQLVEAMTAAGALHLVNAGTSWQHYNNEVYNPVNLYAATKEAFETLLRYYVELKGLKVITLKLFDTYGPGDPRPKLFNFLKKASEGSDEVAMSPGGQLLDLVHVDDVVDAFVMAASQVDKSSNCKEYAVSAGRRMTLREVVEIYGRVTGRHIRVNWGGRPYRMREVMIPWSAGLPIPGWKPRISLEEGIKLADMKDSV